MNRRFMFMKIFSPHGVVASALGLFTCIAAIIFNMFIGKYSRSQVSIYRTIGPLV